MTDDVAIAADPCFSVSLTYSYFVSLSFASQNNAYNNYNNYNQNQNYK